MILSQIRAIPQSTGCLFPMDLFVSKEFKSLVDQQVQLLGIAHRFRPRLYAHSDFVMIKLYAIASQISVHVAAERINTYLKEHFQCKYHLKPKLFHDNFRHRRLVPHQTDVDKYFRRLTQNEVQNLFGNLNMTLCRKISRYTGENQQWRFIADNTEFPYYGTTQTPFEQKTFKKHMGTKRVRMFQGHVVHSQHITLFTDFYLLQKGHCRWLSIPNSIEWLKWNQFHFNYALMDREFYRVQLIKALKNRKIPIIMPAKQYHHVKRIIDNFLIKKGPLVSNYLFQQKTGAKPWPTSTWLYIVISGHDDQKPWKIREQLYNRQITFEEARSQLSAFFTNLRPWKNQRTWATWLMKTYKKRWNQETGFSSLNRVHQQFHYRFPVVQLAEIYLRAMIHNGWQGSRNEGLKKGIHHQHLSLYWYQEQQKQQLEQEFIRSWDEKRKNLPKDKRRLYFA